MVAVTLRFVDVTVDGKDAVQMYVSHDIAPGDGDMPVTPAIRAAAYLIHTYKSYGVPVGAPETVLEGMEQAPAVLDPYPGVQE